MKTRSLAWLVVVALATLAWTSGAAPFKVTPIVNPDGRVLASFSAPSAFSADAEHVMQSGMLLQFTFTVQLRRPSTLWFDRTLAETIAMSSVKYDSLTGGYQVSKAHDGRIVASERKTREADVVQWMTTFDQVPLNGGEPLERNAEYYVTVRLRTSPRSVFSIFPWSHEDGAGRAGFTFIR